MPETLRFESDVANKKGKDFIQLIRTDLKDRQPNIDKRAYIRAVYFGDQNRKLTYFGESNIHLHVLTSRIEGLVPKFVNAFWNAEPIVHVRRVAEEFNEAETDLNELFINWAIESDIPNFYSSTEMWFRNMFLDGVAVVKSWWKFQTRNTVIIETVKQNWRAGEMDLSQLEVPEDRPKMPEELLVEIFGQSPLQNRLLSVESVELTTEIVGSSFRISFVEDRMEYLDILVEIHPNKYIDEYELYIYRPIIIANHPVVEVVEFEDLIVPFRTENIQDAERIAHQYWLTIAELKAKIDFEGWEINDEELSTLRGTARTGDGERHEQNVDNQTLKRQKDRQVGEFNTGDNPTGEEPYFDSKILIYEVYAKDDLTGDGVGEEVVYQIPYKLEKVVKANYLEELFPHGRRPFCDIHNIRISDRYYSLSYGELLAPINVEVNTIITQVNEAQELINHPWFFYVPAAMTVDPEVLSGIDYGEGVPIADINGVMFPHFPQTPLANLSTMDSLLLFADQLTISPQSMGSSQVRNSPRTARGTLALLSEGGIKTDMLITAAQRGGWKELIHQIHALYESFGPEEKWFYVTGEQKPHRISNKDLRGRFEYKFSGNSVNTNREVLRSIAQIRYNTMAAEPLFAQDPIARQALVKDFLRWFSEGTDVDKLLPKLPGQGGNRLPMSQRAELQVMMSGIPLNVLPIDDDAQHLQEIDQFTQSKPFDMLEQWQVALVAQHRNQHIQQLQTKQQEGQVQPGGTQGNNIPTGIGAGTDLNALEGGIQ
jgi:hypothetical protein